MVMEAHTVLYNIHNADLDSYVHIKTADMVLVLIMLKLIAQGQMEQ